MKKQLFCMLLITSATCFAQSESYDSPFEGYIEGQAENVDKSYSGVVGSGFNYQGELLDAGSAANTNFDFSFGLFDAAVGGNQVGGNVIKGNTPVVNGLFSIDDIDFGDAVFDGEELWLRVSVRETGNPGSETTLSPRQRINTVPYAVQADYLGPIGASNGDVLTFTGGQWTPSSGGSTPWLQNGTDLYYSTGDVGIGTSNPAADLMIDADDQSDALRVRINSSTKLSVNQNGGTAIGSFSTPPSDGLFVNGDVKQPTSGNGMMKYMAYVDCGVNPSVLRQYNGVTSSSIAVTGSAAGRCVIDFPTNIDDRFWQVSIVYASTASVLRTANCRLDTGSSDKLFCNVLNADSSDFVSGNIMVLIY